jgi:PilZ domain-containing protein
MLESSDTLNFEIETGFQTSKIDLSNGVVVNNTAKLEALVAEAHYWATAATIITSCTNDMVSKDAADLSQIMLKFVPHEPAILEPLRKGLMDIELSEDMVQSLTETFDLVSSGGDLIAAYADEAEQIGYLAASVIHGDVLMRQWRLICSELNDMLTEIMPDVANEIPPIYSENWRQLQPLLIEAKGGGTPCISNGQLFHPDLPQRRRSSRVGILQACEVKSDGKSFKAFARDISEGGIGLERCPALPVGTLINIKLALGRHLYGHVVWSRANMMGVALFKQLHPNDPLLFG